MFKLVRRASTPFMLANGLLLLFVTLTIFSTKILSYYLLTPAATMAAAFYAVLCVMVCSSFCLLWHVALKDKDLLMQHIPEKVIAIQSRSYRAGVVIYILATALAFVNPWITVGICTASWIYWMVSFKKLDVRV